MDGGGSVGRRYRRQQIISHSVSRSAMACMHVHLPVVILPTAWLLHMRYGDDDETATK